MALILLDAAGVVRGLGAPGRPWPALLDGVAVGDALAERLRQRAAAGDADAEALHRALVTLAAGELEVFEHRHGAWRLQLQACAPGGAVAALLSAEHEGSPEELQRQRERLEDLLVRRTVQLADLRERAEAAGRDRGRLLAEAGRDLRALLAPIVTLAQNLASAPAGTATDLAAAAQAIASQARELGQRLDRWLARIEGRGAGPAAAAPFAVGAEVAAQLRMRHAGRRVLLADDDDIGRLAVQELLSAAGLEVDGVADGLEAVDRAAAVAPALVLLDVHMPRLDGLAAARAMRALPALRATPFVAISAHGSQAQRHACAAAGFDGFLAKPIDGQRLYETLLHWLDARPSEPVPSAPRAAVEPAPAAVPDDAGMAPLFAVEGLDVGRGLAAVGGKAAIYRRLLQVFVQTHAGDGRQISAHLDDGDTRAAASLAHRLRGSAATLGLVDVETAAGALEGAIEDAVDAAALPLLAQAVSAALDATLAGLQPALAT